MLPLSRELQKLSAQKGQFLVRLAASREELNEAAEVRFAVFQRELKAGCVAHQTLEKDQDQYDDYCHHLILIDQPINKIVGTYRMQTYEIASQYQGFYSDQEFDLGSIPQNVIHHAVEIGRACILKTYRNWRTFLLLWHGIARYLTCHQKHYLFGCSSLMSRDVAQGYALMNYFQQYDLLHKEFRVYPKKAYQCVLPDTTGSALNTTMKTQELVLPKLLQIYLKFGARICSGPALDQVFGSIDFFTLFDIKQIQQKHGPFYIAS